MLIGAGSIACFFVACNRPFVSLWVGESNFDGQLLTALLAIGLCLGQLSGIFVQFVFVFGHERGMTLAGVVHAIVAVGASLLLLPMLGSLALPVASILSILLVPLPYLVKILAHELSTTRRAILAPAVSWSMRFLPVLARHSSTVVVIHPSDAGVLGFLPFDGFF